VFFTKYQNFNRQPSLHCTIDKQFKNFKIRMGFQGVVPGEKVLLNLASIPHNTLETDELEIDEIDYDWSKNII